MKQPNAFVLRAVVDWSRAEFPVLAAIVVFGVISALLAAAQPWPLQTLVDFVLAGKPAPRWIAALGLASPTPDAVVRIALLVIALRLLRAGADAAQTRIEVAAGQRCVAALRARLFDHCQRQTLKTHRTQAVGDLLYRLAEDARGVEQIVFAGALPLLSSLLTLFATGVVLVRLDLRLALIGLALVPLLAAGARFGSRPLERASERVREQEAAGLGFAEQILTALPTVKALRREPFARTTFARHSDAGVAARSDLAARDAAFSLAVAAVTTLAGALVLGIGGIAVLRATLSIGQLLVIVAYLAAVAEPLHVAAHALGQIQIGLAGARRVLETLALPAENLETGAPLTVTAGRIVYEDVDFGYVAPPAATLSNIALELTPGTMTAIVGPTGAGKSTLAHLLLRFFEPSAGRITIDGQDIARVSLDSLRGQIGFVPQEPLLFPVSIGENIGYARPDATPKEIEDAARAAFAHDFIAALPDAYATIVAENGASLSHGERQRIALARVFLRDAPILILDEPTSALDVVTEAKIVASLARLTKNRTTLVIAHRLSTIRRADTIVVLDRGRIVQTGTYDALSADGGDGGGEAGIYDDGGSGGGSVESDGTAA